MEKKRKKEMCQHLLGTLLSSAALELLDLSSNGLGAEGARALAPLLGAAARLTSLELSHNDVGILAKAQLKTASLLRSGELIL